MVCDLNDRLAISEASFGRFVGTFKSWKCKVQLND